MTPRQRLNEARALRDSALRLLRADIDMVREDIAVRGVGGRAADRVSQATLDLLDDALDMADEHRGTVAAGLGAVTTAGALWLARGPIFDALAEALSIDTSDDDEQADTEEPADAPARCQTY